MQKRSLFILSILCFMTTVALGQTAGGIGIGDLADNVTEQFSQVGRLMIAISYVAGIAFAIAAIFKFKQHKDNPTQITLGTPLAMLTIGVLLVFLPLLFGPAGFTIFGESSERGCRWISRRGRKSYSKLRNRNTLRF